MKSGVEPVPGARIKRLAVIFGWSLLGILVWLGQVRWPIEPASPELDPSWQQALSHALAHGIRFGADLVFSFGPLGGPQHARYEPGMFWPQIVLYEFLFKGLLVWRWIAALRRFESTPDRIVFGLALISVALNGDVFMLGAVLVIASLLLREEPGPRWERALDCVLLFAIAYVKFTYCVFVLVAAAVIVVDAAFRSRREAWRMLGLLAAAAVVAWGACLQWPWDLPAFVWRSWQLASGYSESQASDGDVVDRDRAVTCLVLWGLMLGSFVLGARARRRALLVAACALFGTFTAFKASFTFHLMGGATFFGFMFLVPVVLVLEAEAHWLQRGVLAAARAALILFALDGYTRGLPYPALASTVMPGILSVEKNAGDLRELPRLEAQLQQRARTLETQFALPRMKSIVGDATVDVIGALQAYAFLNRMRWHPRPVFQSYAATNAALIELNGRFYAGDDAPRFVIFQTATLMGRIPGSEDSEIWRTLLADYRLLCRERGLLLFERDPARAARPPAPAQVRAELEARPMEWVSLAEFDDPHVVVRFDVRYSLYGTLRRHVYHAPITYIDVKTASGAISTWRLVPGQAQAGITLRPWLPFEDDWIAQYAGAPTDSIREFRLRSANDWNSLYQDTYRVVVETRPDSLPEQGRPAWDLAFGSFPTPPLAAESRTSAVYQFISGHEIVLVDADARLVFPVVPGPQRLTGFYGLFPRQPGQGDGVDFKILLVSPAGVSRELFSRTLVHSQPEALRLPIDLPFEAQPGERLVIETSNPPERTPLGDAPYFQALRIGP
jgi:hypothetical protein